MRPTVVALEQLEQSAPDRVMRLWDARPSSPPPSTARSWRPEMATVQESGGTPLAQLQNRPRGGWLIELLVNSSVRGMAHVCASAGTRVPFPQVRLVFATLQFSYCPTGSVVVGCRPGRNPPCRWQALPARLNRHGVFICQRRGHQFSA